MSALPRPLRRRERALAYALAGWSTEVCFTAGERLLHRHTRSAHLAGETYLWMGPIYALCAVLFEPVHDGLRGRSIGLRAASYAAGFTAVEYACGRLIQRVAGVIPWDYTGRGRLVIGGATRLDYLPLWAIAGLAAERIDDGLRSLRVPSG